MGKDNRTVSVSGPGVDNVYPVREYGGTEDVAINLARSAAITYAARPGNAATFYVRDVKGDTQWLVERGEHRDVTIRPWSA